MSVRGGATVERDAAPRSTAPRPKPGGERRHPVPTNPAGLPIRTGDLEPLRGIRYVAWLFKGIAVILLVVMIAEIGLALRETGGMAMSGLFGEAVRLLAFAALLWGGADLALMLIDTHYDLRATRILLTRQTALLERIAAERGTEPLHRDAVAERVELNEI